MDVQVRRCEKIDLSGCIRGRGRPRKSWSEVIAHDLKTITTGSYGNLGSGLLTPGKALLAPSVVPRAPKKKKLLVCGFWLLSINCSQFLYLLVLGYYVTYCYFSRINLNFIIYLILYFYFNQRIFNYKMFFPTFFFGSLGIGASL